jgi:hypothetical protein
MELILQCRTQLRFDLQQLHQDLPRLSQILLLPHLPRLSQILLLPLLQDSGTQEKSTMKTTQCFNKYSDFFPFSSYAISCPKASPNYLYFSLTHSCC